MESKKYNKLVNITKKKQKHRYGEQTSGYQWSGRGNIKVRSGRYEAQGHIVTRGRRRRKPSGDEGRFHCLGLSGGSMVCRCNIKMN